MDADCYPQGRPALLVLCIPDVDIGTTLGEVSHDGWKLLVCGAVHRGVTIFVDRVHINAKFHGDFYGFEPFAICPGVFAWRVSPDSGRGHEDCRIVLVHQQWIGAKGRE